MKVPAQPPELTLLVFLTTSCKTCAGLWLDLQSASLQDSSPGADVGAALVVVTPSKAMESEEDARRLLPRGALLHMDSGTWFSYGVLQAGTFVLVRAAPDGTPPWLTPGTVLGMANVTSVRDLGPFLRRWLAKEAGRCALPAHEVAPSHPTPSDPAASHPARRR